MFTTTVAPLTAGMELSRVSTSLTGVPKTIPSKGVTSQVTTFPPIAVCAARDIPDVENTPSMYQATVDCSRFPSASSYVQVQSRSSEVVAGFGAICTLATEGIELVIPIEAESEPPLDVPSLLVTVHWTLSPPTKSVLRVALVGAMGVELTVQA